MRIVIGFLAALAISETALAGGPFVAVGAEVGSYDTTFPTEAYSDVTLTGRVGYDFGRYFGVEAEGAVNVGGSAKEIRSFADDMSAFAFTDEFEEEAVSRYGVFLRGKLPLSERTDVFIRAGLGARQSTRSFRSDQTNTDGTFAQNAFSQSNSDGFVALGGGLEFDLSADKRNAIRAEYTAYAVLVDTEDETFLSDYVGSISYVRRF